MKTIQTIYNDLECTIDNLRLNVHKHATEYAAIRDTFHGAIGSMDIDSIGITIMFWLRPNQDFTVCAPLIEWLLDRGWTHNDQRDRAGWSWGSRQIGFTKATPLPIEWSHKDGFPKQVGLHLTIEMWITTSNANCKLVEDGVTPKYKIQCGSQ